jgi:hypothetical protein
LGTSHEAAQERNKQSDSDAFGKGLQQSENDDDPESPLVKPEQRDKASNGLDLVHRIPAWWITFYAA